MGRSNEAILGLHADVVSAGAGMAAPQRFHADHQFVLYRGGLLPVAKHLRKHNLASWHELPADLHLSGAGLVELRAVQDLSPLGPRAGDYDGRAGGELHPSSRSAIDATVALARRY